VNFLQGQKAQLSLLAMKVLILLSSARSFLHGVSNINKNISLEVTLTVLKFSMFNSFTTLKFQIITSIVTRHLLVSSSVLSASHSAIPGNVAASVLNSELQTIFWERPDFRHSTKLVYVKIFYTLVPYMKLVMLSVSGRNSKETISVCGTYSTIIINPS
jgi:hypothetical protein